MVQRCSIKEEAEPLTGLGFILMAEETKTEQKTVTEYRPSTEEKELIEKWKKRFKRAKEFRDPFQAKWLRMYKLYRAYQSKENYAYQTRLMPAIAFEIVETVVSRLATAKRKVRILPRNKDDVESESIDSWDDLVNYDFDIIKLKKKLPRWLNSSGLYGNGIAKVTWRTDNDKGTKSKEAEKNKYDDPNLQVVDLWDILPAPETTDLQEDCPWLIHRIVKTKEQIEKEEKAREIVKAEDENGEVQSGKLYKNLECVKPKKVEDWKKERYEINTKKMGQIAGSDNKEEGEALAEKSEYEQQVELWEIWDYEEGKLIVIANEEVLIRNDENPYQNINNGRIFIDLPDHPLNWELWAMGHIEPVETTILEIADLRNQRMDDVILMLDPVTKIRKDAGISKNDIIFAPGAKWELRRHDDVVIERPPEISAIGITEDQLMRNEIERTLALSEYMQGVPKSKQEPAEKIKTLLGQGNLRLNLNASIVAEALTQLANILIQLNEEFITEDKYYRIVGDKTSFKEFNKKDKEIKVDAIVDVEPVIPPDRETRLNQTILLYDKFVAEDKPDPNNEKEVRQWQKRKRELQKMLLEELGKEAYEEVLLGKEEEEITPKKEKEIKKEEIEQVVPTELPEVSPSIGVKPPVQSPGIMRRIINRIPLLRKMG